MIETNLIFHGPAGVLEGVLTVPAEPRLNRVALICHPHSLQGGTMNNKVVSTLVRSCVKAGLPTLRFNFRGVGASAGEFDHGMGETDDCLAAAATLLAHYPDSQLVLAGFSFGSFVAYRASTHLNPVALVLIAPPVERFDFQPFQTASFPWWVFVPEADEVVDVSAMEAWIADYPRDRAPKRVGFPLTSHFFHGQLIALRDAMDRTLVETPWDR